MLCVALCAARRLSVDTLNFGLDRTLGEVHATLSDIKGRRITVNALDQQRFVLEGTDSDGTFFHVSGAERNGAVRALSIVFSDRSSSALVRSIVDSFSPFPEPQPDPHFNAHARRRFNMSRNPLARLTPQRRPGIRP
jgi:hypothetical protein